MDWCSVCSTRHGSDRRDCPGELLASGPERHGRKITVAAHGRNEVYGTLIAEAGEYWRARILTYPNMLWSVPGRRATMKFAGSSAQDVEAQAVAYIRKLCNERRYRIVENVEVPDSAAVEREEAAVRAPQTARDERHLRSYAVQFGAERPTEAGTTADLAREGMFVVTDRPLPSGSAVRLRLELDRYTIPLVGEVVWARRQAEDDRPAGMGVRLIHPSVIYTDLLKSIEQGGEPSDPNDAPPGDSATE